MTLIDKDKLIRELRINPAGCEECEYADAHLNCTRGFQFASACESICEATEIDEADIELVNTYCERRNLVLITKEMFLELTRDMERRTE